MHTSLKTITCDIRRALRWKNSKIHYKTFVNLFHYSFRQLLLESRLQGYWKVRKVWTHTQSTRNRTDSIILHRYLDPNHENQFQFCVFKSLPKAGQNQLSKKWLNRLGDRREWEPAARKEQEDHLLKGHLLSTGPSRFSPPQGIQAPCHQANSITLPRTAN